MHEYAIRAVGVGIGGQGHAKKLLDRQLCLLSARGSREAVLSVSESLSVYDSEQLVAALDAVILCGYALLVFE